MKNKKLAILIAISLLAAGCSPFSQTVPTGVIKNVNGGADWQFKNAVKGNAGASIASLSISKLAFDPSNRQILYAGTYTDGLFKSEDSGESWSKILSKIFVYDFAINPYDNKTIYAAGVCVDHGCVIKTTNGGASWDSEVFHDGSSSLNAVRSIALNPANPNQLVVGTASGNLNKSADGGLSWQLAKNFGDQINRVLWQSGTIYVVLKTKGMSSSSDFGANFKDITASMNKTYSALGLTYIQNGIDSFSQAYVDLTSPTLIYLTTNKGLYKTVDGGITWNKQNLPVKPDQSIARAITIAQSSSNIVFTSVGATIYKSLDGGNTWQTQGISTLGFVNYILTDPVLPQIVYAGIYSTQ